MAPRRPGPRRERTVAANAGEPKTGAGLAAAAPESPTDEELDRRDQMKSGPRRAAGPPLEGAGPEAAPLAELAEESMPAPTDPAE